MLLGRNGNDRLSGDGGTDGLFGGSGSDELTGGAGNDRFHFDARLDAASNVDTVTDFARGDLFMLDDAIFKALLPAGALRAAAFRAGSAAVNADDRILHDAATGTVSYDSDGNAAAAAIAFARVDAGLALSASDFFVS